MEARLVRYQKAVGSNPAFATSHIAESAIQKNILEDEMKKLLFRRGFTDKLYYYNFRTVWLFVIFCYLLTAFSGERWLNIGDLSIVSVGIPAAFAELGIHTGFIIWKAKTEKCRKHKDESKVQELEEMEL